MRLQGKVALVTGAASGLGEAIAARFLKEGAKVVGVDLASLEKVPDPNMIYVQTNVTDPEQTDNAVKQAIEKFGHADILANCAGITLVGTLLETSVDDFKKQFDINVNGIFNMCKSLINQIAGETCSIINIGSELGVHPIPGRVSYSPSKAALVMLTKCIALDYAPAVRANVIHPSLTETPMVTVRMKDMTEDEKDDYRKWMASLNPMKRMCTVEDIANAAVYLASEESNFVTGESLGVCGGGLI